MENYAIEIENLTKRYRKKLIIDSVSLKVRKGEIFGLLGHNGAGKTTILKMIVGLTPPSQGKILINDFDIRSNFEAAIAQVGAIIEYPQMYEFLSGYNNLLHYSKTVSNITVEKIHEIISFVGLENKIHEKVKTYSLGMKQRLGLAQALLNDPKVLILDEPTNGLDPIGIREIRQYLRKLVEEKNLTVLVSSHLLQEMELMCDRIAIIKNGRLACVEDVSKSHLHKDKIIVVFEIDAIEESLKEALKSSLTVYGDVKFNNFLIEFEVTRDQIPQINKELISQEINVYSIKTKEKSLEDRFIEVTGNDKIA